MATQRFDSQAFYERLYSFGRRCRELTEKLSKTIANLEYSSQLIRASGSVGSNYIEALEAMGKKDFIYRLKVSRKEARESVHWLRLISDANKDLNTEVRKQLGDLINEGSEIMKIFTSSILTCEGKKKFENQ